MTAINTNKTPSCCDRIKISDVAAAQALLLHHNLLLRIIFEILAHDRMNQGVVLEDLHKAEIELIATLHACEGVVFEAKCAVLLDFPLNGGRYIFPIS